MKRDICIELIKDFQEQPLPSLIDRTIKIERPKVKKTLVFIGPRRAGKTYFMFNTIQDLENKGLPRHKIIYINLEDDRLLPLNVNDLDAFLRIYYELYPENKDEEVQMFLDEIQNVEGWEIFVRRIMDSENVQIYITGSSSKLLSKEIATSMRGRSLSYIILPFSFKEYLHAMNFAIEKYMSSRTKLKMLSCLSNYLKYGGFPEIVLESNEGLRIKILKEYVDIMLMRDIIERYGIKNITLLRTLYDNLISSTSSFFSVHKFYNYLISQGMKVSKNTLYEYIKHLEDVFAIQLLRRFDYSLRKVQQSLPKIYPIDPGLLLIHGSRFSNDFGKLMEITVALELFRLRSIDPHLEIFYWKDTNSSQKEVDFVIKSNFKVTTLLQVCYNIDDYRTMERELKSLLKAGNKLECKDLLIITWDVEKTEHIKGKDIKYIPLWKWLIGKK